MKKLLFGALLALSVCGNVFAAEASPVSAAEQKRISAAAIRRTIELTHMVSPTTAKALKKLYPELYPEFAVMICSPVKSLDLDTEESLNGAVVAAKGTVCAVKSGSNSKARRRVNREASRRLMAELGAEEARILTERASISVADQERRSVAAIRRSIELTDSISPATAASLLALRPDLYLSKDGKAGSFVVPPPATHVSATDVEMHFLAELTGALCECPICWPDREACLAMLTTAGDARASEESFLAKLVNALRFGR